MVKNKRFPIIIMKSVFTLSIIQLCIICFLLIPGDISIFTEDRLKLISIVPEMTAYAAFTASLAPLSYYVAEKYIKYSK